MAGSGWRAVISSRKGVIFLCKFNNQWMILNENEWVSEKVGPRPNLVFEIIIIFREYYYKNYFHLIIVAILLKI